MIPVIKHLRILFLFCVLLCNAAFTQQTPFWRQIGLKGHAVFSIAIDRDDNIYAGTGYKGLYRSTDMGRTWENINITYFPVDRIECLATAGDSTIYCSNSYRMWISNDRGKTWKEFPVEAHVYSIYAKSEKEVYVGLMDVYDWTGGLVYYSSDNGETWSNITHSLQNTLMTCLYGLTDGSIMAGSIYAWATADKEPPDYWEFYGGVFRLKADRWTYSGFLKESILSIRSDEYGNIMVGTSSVGFFISTDQGSSWEERNNGLNTLYSHRIFSILTHPDVKISPGTFAGFFYSTDKGNSWIRQSDGLKDTSIGV